MSSVLKPDSAVMVGLAEGAAIYAIYNSALPPVADIRVAAAGNRDVEAARKAAAWKSAAVLGVVYLMTRDLNAFLIGGLALAGIDIMVKHADGVHPSTGKLADTAGSTAADNVYPLPDYDSAAPIADAGAY